MSKIQLKNRENTGLKNWKIQIEQCRVSIWVLEIINLTRKCNVLIAFYDMVSNVISNIKLNPIITELFIRCKKT